LISKHQKSDHFVKECVFQFCYFVIFKKLRIQLVHQMFTVESDASCVARHVMNWNDYFQTGINIIRTK